MNLKVQCACGNMLSLCELELTFHSCLTKLTFFLPAVMLTVNAEVVLKVTNVDGVYDADPKHNPNASLLETVSYHEVTTRDLSVMDMTAITLCQENQHSLYGCYHF